MASVDRPMTLLDRLREIELLERNQLEELSLLPEAQDPDPRALGRVVLQRGWLTRFQITQAALGRGRELRVGPYVLLDRLGEGGMGTVYKARHCHLQRVVALKVIRKERLSNPNAVRRFYQEIQAAGQLSHPNIVLAYDAGQVGNTHFFAMEYVEGTDLAQLVRQNGPLPVAQACDYVRQAALGLQHAHERGLVHRDIKPSNLLVSRAAGSEPAVVKVLDMGLARLQQGNAEPEQGLTRMGQVVGTPDYLAPEQAVDSRAVDIRADLYSFGCTLYYLLSGQPPFLAGTLTGLLLKHQMEEPVPLARWCAEVPAEVQALVRKLMAKRPEDRYQTPAELAAALEPFCRGEGRISGSHAERGNPTGTLCVPSRVTDGTQSVPACVPTQSVGTRAGMAGQAGTGTVWETLSVADEVVKEPTWPGRGRGRKRATEVLEEVEGATPARGKPWLWAAVGGGAAAVVALVVLVLALALKSGKPAPALTAMPPPGGADNRPEEPKRPPAELVPDERLAPGLVPVQGPARPGGPDQGPAPPGNPVLAGGGRTFPSHDGWIVDIVISPDGRQAVSAGGSSAWLWNVDTGEVVRRFQGQGGQITSLSVSWEKHLLLTGGPDRTVRLWDLHTGQPLRQLGPHETPVYGVALSPDGRHAVLGSGGPLIKDGKVVKEGGKAVFIDCDVRLLDVASWKEVDRLRGHNMPVHRVLFSPDGRRALSCSSDGCCVWDVDKRSELRRIPGRWNAPAKAAFAPDGRQVFLSALDQTIRLWDVEAGREVRRFAGHTGMVQALAVSADGRRLFSGGGTLYIDAAKARRNVDCGARLWDVASGRELARFETPDRVRAVAIAPDGRYGLTGSYDHVLRLWDLPRGGPPAAGDDRRRRTILPAVRGGGERGVSTPRSAPAPAAEERRFAGHAGTVTCLAVAPNGRYLLTGGEDRSVRLWDLSSGKELKRFGAHRGSGAIRSVAFSADSRKAVSADANGLELVWSVETLQVIRSVSFGNRPAGSFASGGRASAAFAPDGRWVVLGAGINLYLQDLEDGGKLYQHARNHGTIHSVAWSPDGSAVAVGEAGGSVRLWDPLARKEAAILPLHKGAVLSVAFAPKNFLLLSGGEDRALVVWDVKTGVVRRRLTGHTGRVHGVAFSPDGKLAVSGSQDTTVRVWGLSTRQELKRFTGHKEEVRGVAFTPDGRRVISCGDGIKVWDLPAELRPRKATP